MKVFLSPSNQIKNTWAVGNTNEMAQAEAFADKLQALLEKQGVEVVRADDVAIKNRIDYAEGCDLIIPLHTNAYNKKVRGCRLYAYKTKKNTPAALAAKNAAAMKAIQAEVDKLGMSRKVIVNYDYANWTELSNATAAGIPAVYSESIFHDNVEDCNWYFANVDRLVEAYAKGICAYGGVTYKQAAQEAPSAPQEPEKVDGGKKIYRVQVGAFEDRDNAKVMKQKLSAAGFVGFIVEEILQEQAAEEAPNISQAEIDKMARDVLNGKYGNGQERKEKLGDLYDVVQARANEIYKSQKG